MLRYRLTNAQGKRAENAIPVGLVRDLPNAKAARREVEKLGLLARINEAPAPYRIRFDALCDLCTAESVYQMVCGNHAAAATLFDALQSGQPIPDPQVVQQPRVGGVAATLLTTPLAVQSVALSRDGERIAWIASRAIEGSKTPPEFTLQWRTLAGGTETSVRLQPGERITSPTF